jgi:hypothetical protein
LTKGKSAKLTELITLWIAKRERPINIVEDTELAEAFQYATGCKSYQLPSRYVINSQMDQLYSAKRNELAQKLAAQPNKSVALTLDYWTSLQNENYLGVTCHYIQDNSWLMSSHALAVDYSSERHTSENVKKQIIKILKDWDIEDKVIVIITDNAANMVKAAKELPYGSFTCASHSLQLSLNKALKECNADFVLAKLRRIVGHFKRSPASFAELTDIMVQQGEKAEALVSYVTSKI